MCYKHEGKWTQIQSIYYENQEDEYLLAELEHCIDGFNIVKEYNSVYLSLFAGEIKIKEAAELLGVSRITVIRVLTKYRLELYTYLESIGYRYEDLLEIYKSE
jgi:DNA-directed RNA polymerase specialized sigma subunit